MDGKNAILNLLAINQAAKFETWYDEIMMQAVTYAVQSIAEKEGLDVDEIVLHR